MEECRPDCTFCHPPIERCDKCQTVIPRANHGNLDGGMRLYFEGWYGGTIDPWRNVMVMLCASCAKAYLRAESWLARVSPELTAPPEKWSPSVTEARRGAETAEAATDTTETVDGAVRGFGATAEGT